MTPSPCPFCNSKDIHIIQPTPTYTYILCGACGAQGPMATSLIMATQRWDKRHENSNS